MTRSPIHAIHTTALAVLLAFFLAPQAGGWEYAELIPTFSLTGNYDDNIEFSPRDELEDFYAEISPGLDLRLNLPVIPVEASYQYTRYQYREESQLNRDYHNLSVTIPHGIRVTPHLYIEIEDKYEIVPVDVTLPEDQTYNLTQRNTFLIGPYWESYLSRKLKLRAGYEFSRVDYTSSGFTGDDYFGHRIYDSLNYEIDRSLTCFQRNSYRIRDYSEEPDYHQFIPEAGLNANIAKRISVSASGGYSFEEIGTDRSDGYVYTLKGIWAATAKLDLGTEFRHRRTVDINNEPYTERYGGVFLDYRPVEKLLLESYVRYYDYTFSDDYRRIAGKLGLVYRLNKWSSFNCGYHRYQTVDTPSDEKAVANRFYAGIRIAFGTL